MVQDGDKRQVLVNSIVNFRVPHNVVHCLLGEESSVFEDDSIPRNYLLS
jgi:hypothetical protein